MSTSNLAIDALRLKAAIEFGSEYTYQIRNGGLGLTLYVDAETREKATPARKKIPGNWEGLYVVVLYNSEGPEDILLSDVNFS